MELGVHFVRPLHGDRVRKMGIHSPYPRAFRARDIDVEMDNLRRRVNAGVRAPSSGDTNWDSRDRCECVLNSILNGVARRLRLPALEWRAVISDAQRYSHALQATRAASPRPSERSLLSSSFMPAPRASAAPV